MKKHFSIIVAFDHKRGIGKTNKLPWHLPGDFKHFRTVTITAATQKKNAVIMGRKTWESISEKHRPLPDRLNVVLTKQTGYELPNGVLAFSSLDDALLALSKDETLDKCFVIGGAEIYRQALKEPELKQIYATQVNGTFECDTFFPNLPSNFKIASESDEYEENGVKYSFREYIRDVN